jgi:hypothetical protein
MTMNPPQGRVGGAARRIDARGAGVIASAVLLAVAAGCQNQDKSGSVSRLSARDVPYLEGVAVPAKFKMVNPKTEDYESGGKRWARHEYAGWAEPEDVRQFYKDQMPLLGWARVTDHNIKGTITLRFERRGEACDVIISTGRFFNRTEIRVVVLPFARTGDSGKMP